MKLFHIVAVALNGTIGKENKLPWPRLPSDMKHFKQTTLGSTVIMGRKTFESLGSKPLPERQNIVLSRTPAHIPPADNLRVFASLDEALQNVSTEKAFIIGGADVYKQTLERVDGIFLTRVGGVFPGDASYIEVPSYFKIKSIDPLEPVGELKLELIEFVNTKKPS